MPTRTIEYRSLQYLNQWIIRDSRYCDGLANGSESSKLRALVDAAGFYRISRNLPLAADVKKGLPRYKPLLDVSTHCCRETSLARTGILRQIQ